MSITLRLTSSTGTSLVYNHLTVLFFSVSDMMERNALSAAQSLATQVQMLCLQAQNASPFVQSIGALAVAQGYVSIFCFDVGHEETECVGFATQISDE